jgi:chromosomal replication initiator protein
MDASNIWDDVISRIEAKVNRHSFYTWFKPTSYVADQGSTIVVKVPDPVFRDWLTRHYAALIAEALEELGRPAVKVTYIADASEEKLAAVQIVEAPPSLSEVETSEALPLAQEDYAGVAYDGSPAVGLNARYTFDTFVVGSSNQFAEAACRAVAEMPSRSYNPLYIYGGVGLGKTHLMHAIGHYALRHNPGFKLTYISTERFMNEMINAVHNNRIIDFRSRYRSVDLLLVDDIQFLAGKEGTQTEFFHTFNALYDSQKQIVLSSDCPPNEIPSLEERLRSRFEWGLIADIQAPDLETKIAILKKKAQAELLPLPDNVAIFIAERIKSNIRELEGSLIRLIAYASLTHREVTMALAQEVLKNLGNHEDRALTADMIQKAVADYYQLKPVDLRSRNNSKSIAMPRQIAMFLCKSLTSASLPEIGRSFGGKHHSTVIHSIRKIETLRQKDSDFNRVINTLIESLR